MEEGKSSSSSSIIGGQSASEKSGSADRRRRPSCLRAVEREAIMPQSSRTGGLNASEKNVYGGLAASDNGTERMKCAAERTTIRSFHLSLVLEMFDLPSKIGILDP